VRLAASFVLVLALSATEFAQVPRPNAPARRIVILKIDGLGAGLLYGAMRQTDPETGKSLLPWFSYVFGEHGTVFDNFYTRGMSLSAPSWSMLDTGQHSVIRGNVEYDRYTGEVYDYLNFFPLYIGYARKRNVDMPGVEVLDRAGIPLVIDRFPDSQAFQSFQLLQRGVRWTSLEGVLKQRFSTRALLSAVESGGAPSFESELGQQTEHELDQNLSKSEILYLDDYTGDVDHTGHETSDAAALMSVLKRLDALTGRIWTAIQKSPLADRTLFVVVSDHGMNNVPGIVSQTFSLPDFFNSPEGGGHHVVTDRQQLSDFKLRGLDPLVHRVVTPSVTSFYLSGEAEKYPTAWLDIDGNERAAVQLRNSDLNKIHILLIELSHRDLPPEIRRAAGACLLDIIERHRRQWNTTVAQLTQELSALDVAIANRKRMVEGLPNKTTSEECKGVDDNSDRRLRQELRAWSSERSNYGAYLASLKALLSFRPDSQPVSSRTIAELIPAMSLGDANTIHDLLHYAVGPSPGGLVLSTDGKLDEDLSFRYVNNFAALAAQRVRNNPQVAVSPKPIDFLAVALPSAAYSQDAPGLENAYWLYGDAGCQIVILTDAIGRIAVKPVKNLTQDEAGRVSWTNQPWRAGLPLQLFEDPALVLPPGSDRAAWLSQWHSEREWFNAIHLCRYSNGVIGITEELSPVAANAPGAPGINPILLRYEQRRRQLVQADFHIFASDHSNFNVRFPNPGGNHGSFLRISTQSVWMMAGAGIPERHIEQPYDSLNFASTILNLLGRRVPMPDRIVNLDASQ
jgi:Type I phosphodiesterase / nucleotide pyrophosphatase